MRKYLYLIAFLFVVHNALLMYVNSSYLGSYIPTDMLGIIYTLAALFTIFLLSKIPTLLARFGHRPVTITLGLATIISLVGLVSPALGLTTLVIVPFFLLHEIGYVALRGNMDIYLEHYSHGGNTGSIRGYYMTAMNMAIALSPLIVSFVLTDGDYWKIYALSLAVLILLIFIALPVLKRIPDTNYNHRPFWHSLPKIWAKKNIRNVFMSQFLMQFFFSWMVIYTPIYLHQHIGFSWEQLGVIFAIMLIPYVLFEIPLGRIADKVLGEKEFLMAGFLIMAVPTAIMSFITTQSFLLWTVILFVSRVGASFVEIMSETYFFKKVDATNTNTIEFFRDARPMGYIVGPALASLLLAFIDIQYLFLALAIITLSGLYFASQIKDTK